MSLWDAQRGCRFVFSAPPRTHLAYGQPKSTFETQLPQSEDAPQEFFVQVLYRICTKGISVRDRGHVRYYILAINFEENVGLRPEVRFVRNLYVLAECIEHRNFPLNRKRRRIVWAIQPADLRLKSFCWHPF